MMPLYPRTPSSNIPTYISGKHYGTTRRTITDYMAKGLVVVLDFEESSKYGTRSLQMLVVCSSSRRILITRRTLASTTQH
ncbi:hypothetical protein V8C44DRAFT_337885 [Trichoderma aethiopicum]